MRLNENKILTVLILLCLTVLVAGCSLMDNNFDTQKNLEDHNISYLNEYYKSQNKAVIQIAIDSNTKSALPSISLESFSSFVLSIKYRNSETIYKLFSYNSYADLINASIEIIEGEYDFCLSAGYDNILYSSFETYKVNAGLTKLSFVLNYSGIIGSTNGKGNFEVSLSCTEGKDKIKVVKAGLYTLNGTSIPDYPDEIVFNSKAFSEVITYKKNDVPSGSYFIRFTLYADDDCNCVLGKFQEYVVVTKDKFSYSSPEYSGLVKYCCINYELKGGKFKDTDKPVSAYTRYSGVITPLLPEGKDEKWVFDGWYADSDYQTYVTSLNCTNAKDITLYAKWKIGKTIIFDGVSRKFGEGALATSTKEIIVPGENDKQIKLPTADELNLSKVGGRLLGWTLVKGNRDNLIEDGSIVELQDQTTLFAEYSNSKIRSDSTEDTDNDGIIDKNELEMGTNPDDIDTDGDGFIDGVERNMFGTGDYTFNPLIADIPKLSISIGDPSQITISRSYTTTETESTGKQETATVSLSSSETKTNTKSTAQSSSQGDKVGVEISQEFSKSPKATLKFSYEHSWNSTETSSVSFASSDTKSWGQNSSNGKTYSEGKTQTNTGGSIKVPVKLKNSGYIAYSISNITLSLYLLKRSGIDEYDELVKKTEVKGPIDLSAFGQTTTLDVVFELGESQINTLLTNSRGFTIVADSYNISATALGKDGKPEICDFISNKTSINAKCADVCIGFGKAGQEHNIPDRMYKVAVKNKYNTDAGSAEELLLPVTLRDVLSYIGIKENAEKDEFKLVTDSEGRIKSIAGIESTNSYQTGAWEVLISHIDINQKIKSTYYIINESDAFAYKRFGSDIVKLEYNIDDIHINAKDKVVISYFVDADNDGVDYCLEQEYGTTDDPLNTKCKDFDEDGLTDYQEIFGWKKRENGEAYRTNPVDPDTDGDAAVHDNDLSKWGDLNDPDPTIHSLSDSCEIKSLRYSLDGITYNDAIINDTTGEITLQDTTVYDCLYLNFETKSKKANVFVSKQGSDGNYVQENGYVIYEKAVNFKTNIILAPEKANSIKIQIQNIKDSNIVNKEYTLSCYSKFRKAEKKNYITGSFNNTSKFVSVSLPKTNDKRFVFDNFSKLKSMESIGYMLAVSRVSQNKDPEFIYNGKLPFYDNESNKTINRSTDWQFFAFQNFTSDQNLNAIKLDLENYSFKIYYKWFAYVCDSTGLKLFEIIDTTDKVLVCEMPQPKYAQLVMTLDGIMAIVDHDGGARPEYRGEFSTLKGNFDASNLNFETDRICQNEGPEKCYVYESDGKGHKQASMQVLGSGKQIKSLKFPIKQLQQNCDPIILKLYTEEIDHTYGGGNDTIGSIYIRIQYNPETCAWGYTMSLNEDTIMNTTFISKPDAICLDSDDLFKVLFQFRNKIDGEFDVQCSLKWEVVD